MKIKIIFFFTLLTCIGFSQDNKNQIDVEFEKCLSNDTATTYVMLYCVRTARDLWEGEMNKYYNLLMSKIDAEQQNKLKESQEKWVEFKNAEIAFSNLTYYNMEGTMWRVIGLSNQKDIYKQRATELRT